MATIRYGSTAGGGKPVWTTPKPITPVDLNAQTPVPPMPAAKATIKSFQTPVQVGQTALAVAQITQGKPDRFRWQYMSGAQWITAADNPASDLDHHYLFTKAGNYPIRLQTIVNGAVVDQTGTARVIQVTVAPQPPEPPQPGPPVPGPGQILVRVISTRTNLGLAGAKVWAQTAPSVITLTDLQGYAVVTVSAGGVCAEKDGYHSPGVPTQIETCMVVASTVILGLEPFPPPVPPLEPLHSAGHYFALPNGQAWRYKGVSSFKLMHRWVNGENIQPVLDAYAGYNTLRVWPYVNPKDWGADAWNSPTPQQAVDFVRAMADKGWRVEFTCLTDSDPIRIPLAKDFIAAFKAASPKLTNLFLEAANEPEVQHDGVKINTAALRPYLEQSGFPYASGDYLDINGRWYGSYLTTHTKRDPEWVRRTHDGLDIYNGAPDDPASKPHHVPILFDEPAKLEDVGGDHQGDWLAYFGSGALFGAGVTFHSATGKLGLPPVGEEITLAAKGLAGLDAYPPDAPNGAYSRVNDNTLRTYIIGNCMVRMRPTTPNAPQPGWVELNVTPKHILWKR